MAKCFYCQKKLWGWSRKRPIHPKDGDSLKLICCDECWQSKVAEVGLTKATGKKDKDGSAVVSYVAFEAKKHFEDGNYDEALKSISCAEELSFKSLGSELGAGSALGSKAHELRGDCYRKLGRREEAFREYIFAHELTKQGQKRGGTTPWGVLFTVTEAAKTGFRMADLETKIGILRAEPLVEEILRTYELEELKELREGLKRKKEKYCLYTPEDLTKDSAEYYVRLGFNAIVRGNYDIAIKSLKDAAEMDPKYPVVFYWLGSAYYERYRGEKSKKGLSKMISRVSPEELSEMKAKAEDNFERAIDISVDENLVTQAKKRMDELNTL